MFVAALPGCVVNAASLVCWCWFRSSYDAHLYIFIFFPPFNFLFSDHSCN